MTKDMTNGSPMKLILRFALPLSLGLLFQQIYSLVDTIIVGKTLGVDALAAVGSTGSINFLVIGSCTGICSGLAIPIAQRFGARDYSAMRKFIGNSVWMSVAFALILTVITAAACRQILLITQTPDNIIDMAYDYIVIIFLGIPATFLYNLCAGILRSIGDSRTPVIFLIIAALLNIFLDLFLIIVCNMGVAGAAYATVASQAISGFLCLIYMRIKFEILRMSREEWRPDGKCLGILLYMGVPMGLQYSITAIGSVTLQAFVNTLGSDCVASVAAAAKLSMFMVCPIDAVGTTMTTYGGQNVGAGKLERIGAGVKAANILSAIYAAFALVFLFFTSRLLLLLFVDASETQIISDARTFLLINASAYFLLGLLENFRFLIQGMGFSGFAIFAGVSEMIARILVGVFLIPAFGFTAACFGSPVAWVFACAFLIPAYYHVKRRCGKMMGRE